MLHNWKHIKIAVESLFLNVLILVLLKVVMFKSARLLKDKSQSFFRVYVHLPPLPSCRLVYLPTGCYCCPWPGVDTDRLQNRLWRRRYWSRGLFLEWLNKEAALLGPRMSRKNKAAAWHGQQYVSVFVSVCPRKMCSSSSRSRRLESGILGDLV